MPTASGYLRSAVLWAMIPLTLFAGRPATGCTCASGEYKLFCSAHLSRGTVPHQGAWNGVHGPRACCRQGSTDAPCCCREGHCGLVEGQGLSGSNKCCNPDTVTVMAAASPVMFSVDCDHHLLFDLPLVESDNLFADAAAADFVAYDTGPPGGDLVISLRRLLI